MKENYLFLGFAIPDEEMQEIFKNDKFPSIQTHKFNWNLIKGLEMTDKYEFTYISTRAISDYPHYGKQIIKKKKWRYDIDSNEINIFEIPFINTSLLKVITRFFSGLYYSIKNYNRVKEKSGVIVYSVHLPFMIIGYIISKLYGIDFIAIWTDPPSVINGRESLIKKKLRNIEYKVSKYYMNKVSKVISITKYLAEDFAPNKPYIVVEGIIDEKDINSEVVLKNKNDVVKFVYTGSLEKRYGIDNIVNAFKKINNKNIVLEIYGRGDYEEELKKIVLEYNNIVYGGFLANNDILDIQRKADFLINARSADDEYVKYSFPSKTIEYMISGTPLITTMLKGIPNEYEQYIIKLEDNKVETIYKKINDLISIDVKERNLIGLKAKEFVKGKNYINQGIRISKFIDKNI